MTAFVKSKVKSGSWYWIGLHRSGGKLQWAGGRSRAYTEVPLRDAWNNYFEAAFNSRRIDGVSDSETNDFFCRRA